jgi:methylthioribulose-1-phosphate dehydratase
MRLDDGSFAATVSGKHKGRLTTGDVMRVDSKGNSLDGKKPSAWTELHLDLYARFPECGAVLHSHSSEPVGLSRAFADADSYTLAAHEMLKLLPRTAPDGIRTGRTRDPAHRLGRSDPDRGTAR